MGRAGNDIVHQNQIEIHQSQFHWNASFSRSMEDLRRQLKLVEKRRWRRIYLSEIIFYDFYHHFIIFMIILYSGNFWSATPASPLTVPTVETVATTYPSGLQNYPKFLNI